MHRAEPMGFAYGDTRVVQQSSSMRAIFSIIRDNEIETVIELGTHFGGFALMVSDCFKSLAVHTFDKTDQYLTDAVRHSKKIKFNKVDVLNDPDPVLNLLKLKKKTLLYCDNGDKIKEFDLYADGLKPGDIIGCHDWGTEIDAKDIADIITDDKFVPVEHDLFQKEMWLARFWQKIVK